VRELGELSVPACEESDPETAGAVRRDAGFVVCRERSAVRAVEVHDVHSGATIAADRKIVGRRTVFETIDEVSAEQTGLASAIESEHRRLRVVVEVDAV